VARRIKAARKALALSESQRRDVALIAMAIFIVVWLVARRPGRG
jgi:hypothetical protein